MPFENVQRQFKETESETIDWFQKEISSLRSNRVKPDIVESLQVEAYGARSPLNNVASITSSDARTLVVSPWDKSVIAAIEKAITEANLGVQPIVDGQIIRLSFPSLTEEVRQQTLKMLHNKAEEARIRLRQGRDEAIKMLKQEKESSVITEDDFFDGKKKMDDLITEANETINEIVAKKEVEIKTI